MSVPTSLKQSRGWCRPGGSAVLLQGLVQLVEGLVHCLGEKDLGRGVIKLGLYQNVLRLIFEAERSDEMPELAAA